MRRSLVRSPVARDLGELPVVNFVGEPPRVTVVMATYNRSNVLRHALESVRSQTFPDWEALVIGDACTDDTAEVVAGMRDPRFHYLNLPVNLGDHSGPNSIGARLARGSHLTWLSQDDLWFPDHLERLLGVVDESGADGAIGGMYLVREIGPRGLADPATRIEARSTSGRLRVTGHRNHPASTWLLAASTVEKVGDWRPATAVRYATSQEYLFRVWASGARVVVSPTPTTVLVPSIVGSRSYGSRRDDEQNVLAPAALAGDHDAFDGVVRRTAIEPFRLPEGIGVTERPRSAARRALARHSQPIHRALAAPLARLGIPPWELAGYLVGEVPGESNAILRMLRGLPGASGSELDQALVATLQARLDAAEATLAELSAELTRTQNDYRARDAELRELGIAYARQSAELARAQQDYRDRDAEVAELRRQLDV